MPSIPPIDQAFIDQVQNLNDEASEVLHLVAALSQRVGAAMEQMDEIEECVGDGLAEGVPTLDLAEGLAEYTRGIDEAVDNIRSFTGYDDLMEAMGSIASHAGAASGEPTASYPDPDWWCQLRERRRARWAVA